MDRGERKNKMYEWDISQHIVSDSADTDQVSDRLLSTVFRWQE